MAVNNRGDQEIAILALHVLQDFYGLYSIRF